MLKSTYTVLQLLWLSYLHTLMYNVYNLLNYNNKYTYDIGI